MKNILHIDRSKVLVVHCHSDKTLLFEMYYQIEYTRSVFVNLFNRLQKKKVVLGLVCKNI